MDSVNQTIIQCATSYGPWITAGAILLSALIGAVVAFRSISEQRTIAKKRATLDMLAQKEWDRDYIDARAEFVQLRDAVTGLEFWADKEHKNSPQNIVIRNTLNDYELIAVGIREDILDEELYRRWFKTSFLKDMDLAQEYIAEIRKQAGTNAIFSESEWLAKKWRGGT